MPELPDLQVFRKNLESKLKGKTLKALKIYKERKLNVPPDKLKKSLISKKLNSIERIGKELFFHFNDQVLSFHLMLKGKFEISDGKSEVKYPVGEFHFDDGSILYLTDPRGMARINLNPKISKVPDALSKELTRAYFIEVLKKHSSKNIKELITDQKIIKGIGNAYSDEILWAAKIHPLSSAGKIPEHQTKELNKQVKKILADAEKKILKSHPDIIGGEVRDFLKIHNSRLKESPSGAKIKKIEIGGRSTYFTGEQVLYN